MSSPIPVVSHAVRQLSSTTKTRAACVFRISQPAQRNLSTTVLRLQDQIQQETPEPETQVDQEPPRWSRTPPAMQAPVRARLRGPGWVPYECNVDPHKLDAMYSRFLGRQGPRLLSDETKWLAVTHKSFDHGRRGFNDRLAFLGKRIVELQTSLTLLARADNFQPAQRSQMPELDAYGRQAFEHPALANIEILNGEDKKRFLHHRQIAHASAIYGIPEVVRWAPKDVEDLQGSGSDMVYAQAVYAIIGALSIEQGALVAGRVARERVLQAVGLNTSQAQIV